MPNPKRRILFVDDDAQKFALMLPRLLHEYELRFEESGLRALSTASDFLPDVFLLDQTMPEIDGTELADRIRGDARFARTPIILISGTVRSLDDDLPIMIGALPALSKPFSVASLKRCIEQQLSAVCG